MRMVSNQFHALARKGRILQHDGEPQQHPLPLPPPLARSRSFSLCPTELWRVRLCVRLDPCPREGMGKDEMKEKSGGD
jgi:hypothetical protein